MCDFPFHDVGFGRDLADQRQQGCDSQLPYLVGERRHLRAELVEEPLAIRHLAGVTENRVAQLIYLSSDPLYVVITSGRLLAQGSTPFFVMNARMSGNDVASPTG